MPSRKLSLTVLGLAAVALAGCGDARKSLGLAKSPPDEFQVVARAPLALPPSYELRPPAPGSRRPQEGRPTDQARQAVFGRTAAPNQVTGVSSAESSFLQAAGANQADPNIRRTVDSEAARLASANKTFIQQLLFWQKPKDPNAQVIDPQAETQRIRSQSALGEPVTGGVTIVRDE